MLSTILSRIFQTKYNPNNYAFALSLLCMDFKLVTLNNLKAIDKEFLSNLTNKQGKWTPELHICIVLYDMIDYINQSSVYETDFLPSVYAPLSLKLSLLGNDTDDVLVRAGHSGEQYVSSLAPQE